MTAKHYLSAGTLADHFEHWRHRLGSDREASKQVQRSINNEWLVCDRPLPADFKLTRIAGKIMVETREGMSDAADYRVGRLPDPASLKADKLRPSEQAAIEAMFPVKPAVESPAPPPVEAEPPPAPIRPVKEGARKRTDPATRARAEIVKLAVEIRRNKIRAAFAKAALAKKARPSAQQLADKFHVSLRTIKRDLEHLDDSP